MRSFIWASLLTLMAFLGAPAMACTGDSCAAGLAYEAFGAATQGQKPILVVFVHGSVSKGGPADYMYPYAKRFAEGHKNVVAVALLQPGYYDANGKRSDGSDGGRRLPDNTSEITAAVRALQSRFGARSVFAVGHSMGSMNLGVIIGTQPDLLKGVVLTSGVYDTNALSEYRHKPQGGVSGLNAVSGISKAITIVAVHGTADDVVPIDQSRHFIAAAQQRGLNAKLVEVSGVGHDWSGALPQAVMSALDRLVR
ncbi:MAG: prolyl oligopeptidase family serine peptidase [Ancalomicrobiaceae bacterium]|nr:prolyl oligopeptidase family serine peptidase [Ancalomicrobiaceae bacterium]